MISYNHKTTKLPLLQWAILQLCSIYGQREAVTKTRLVELTNTPSATITAALKELALDGLITDSEVIVITEAGWNILIGADDDETTEVGDVATLAGEVIAYLNEKTDSRFSGSTEAIKKMFRALLKRIEPIDKRKIAEKGWTLAELRALQCKSIVDLKIEEWKGTTSEKYLRPSTLFGPNFWTYLEQARSKIRKKNE